MTHTRRIALTDPQVLQCVTTVVAVRPDAFATAESPFFSGGGGQPADIGSVSSGGRNAAITGVSVDDADLLWHETTTPPPLGSSVDLVVDRPRRRLISRMHTALHVLNTLALQHYGAWTTGAQITVDYGRLDISATELTPALVDDLETKMNAVLTAYHAVRYLFWRRLMRHSDPISCARKTSSHPSIGARSASSKSSGSTPKPAAVPTPKAPTSSAPVSFTRAKTKGAKTNDSMCGLPISR